MASAVRKTPQPPQRWRRTSAADRPVVEPVKGGGGGGEGGRVRVGAGRDIGPGEQVLGTWFLIVAASLDRSHLGRLVGVDVDTTEMSEEELDRNQHSGETKTHAQHDAGLGVI